jgi:hypothetical protein
MGALVCTEATDSVIEYAVYMHMNASSSEPQNTWPLLWREYTHSLASRKLAFSTSASRHNAASHPSSHNHRCCHGCRAHHHYGNRGRWSGPIVKIRPRLMWTTLSREMALYLPVRRRSTTVIIVAVSGAQPEFWIRGSVWLAHRSRP